MKITASKIIFISALMVVSFASHVFAQRNNLGDIRWELVSAYGQAARNSNAYIKIDKGRFTGNTGCNSMFGSVTVRGDRIDLSSIGSTKRMCKMMPGSVPESTFIKGLNDAARFSRNGDSMSLLDRRGRTVLRFQAAKRGAEPGNASLHLEDRKWMLESIGGRQTFAPIIGVFVSFDPKKQIAGGNTGCNVFGGTYSATGSAISITQTVSTMRACEEGNKMQIEREFLDGLRRANRFEIRDEHLYLYAGSRQLLSLRGEIK